MSPQNVGLMSLNEYNRSLLIGLLTLELRQGLAPGPEPLSKCHPLRLDNGRGCTEFVQTCWQSIKNRPLRSGRDVSWGLTFSGIGETGFEPAASCSQSDSAL